MSFESVLDTAIPWILFLIFGFIFYKALNRKGAMSTMFSAIGRAIGWCVGKITGQGNDEDTVRNEYSEVVFR